MLTIVLVISTLSFVCNILIIIKLVIDSDSVQTNYEVINKRTINMQSIMSDIHHHTSGLRKHNTSISRDVDKAIELIKMLDKQFETIVYETEVIATTKDVKRA